MKIEPEVCTVRLGRPCWRCDRIVLGLVDHHYAAHLQDLIDHCCCGAYPNC